MTLPLLLFAVVCVVNGPRSRTAVSRAGSAGAPGRDVRVAALGAGLTLLVLVPVAAFAEPLLDLVSISAPTARLACGLLLVAMGVLAFGSPGPDPEPALPGWRAGLVPVAFPTLFTPGLAVLTLSASVDHSAVVALVAAAVALVTVPAVAALPVSRGVSPRTGGPVSERVLDGVGRLLAALLVLAGLGLLFEGVFDV